MKHQTNNKPKANWLEIKETYQRGEGSCRELAERFGVSEHAAENRCRREGWRKEKMEIGGKVAEMIVEKVSDKATAHVKATLALCEALYADIQRSREQLLPAIDPPALDALARALTRINQVARQTLGIAEQPAQVNVTTNEMAFQQQLLNSLAAARTLAKEKPELLREQLDLIDIKEIANSETIPD